MIDGLRVLEHVRTMQNVVLKVTSGTERFVLRLTDPKHRPVEAIEVELKLLADLRRLTACTIHPRPFQSGRFLESVQYNDGRYNAVMFPYIDGGHAAASSFDTASRLGELLADLHTSLGALDEHYDLPVMQEFPGADQLIHGDFGSGNVLRHADSFVVIDFENACYSTYEYELANSIYMVLFANRHALSELAKMDYAHGLMAGYCRHRSIDRSEVSAGIHTRIRLLSGWVRDPATAPLAIATSTQEWKAELAQFIQSYESGRFDGFLCNV